MQMHGDPPLFGGTTGGTVRVRLRNQGGFERASTAPSVGGPRVGARAGWQGVIRASDAEDSRRAGGTSPRVTRRPCATGASGTSVRTRMSPAGNLRARAGVGGARRGRPWRAGVL